MSENDDNRPKIKGARAKKRLDVLLVDRGLAESRQQAQRMIMSGSVKVTHVEKPKPGHSVPVDAEIQITARERYVSRGGLKLEEALNRFHICVEGCVAADIGASTGGFTDCLLQHGAARVFAVDVGATQMHERVRNDPRVTIFENTNARNMAPDLFPEPIALFAVDVSFISLAKILPAITQCAHANSQCVLLIKPQFEATPAEASKGRGLITHPEIHRRILGEFLVGAASLGWKIMSIIPSPIRGGSGNIEYLAHAVRMQPEDATSAPVIDIDAVIARAV